MTEHAPPSPVSSNLLKDYYDRGERAWAKYLRNGVAVPAEAVFARLDALVEKRRAALLADIVDAPSAGVEAFAASHGLERTREGDGGAEASGGAGSTKAG